MMGEALNMRLGTEGLNMRQIMAEAAHRGKTVMELLAEPELDEYVYSDGPSMVCSCFVAGIYKAGGVFGDMNVEATEFSPKDVYQMKIYNETYVPEKCSAVDPDLPYCQILGKYKLTLPGFNTIDLYENMNNHCPSLDSDNYFRPDGC